MTDEKCRLTIEETAKPRGNSMIKKFLGVIVFISFALCFISDCLAEKQSYRNTEGHFSFVIPEGWQEIPKESIGEYYKNIKLPRGIPASNVPVPDAWFQKKTEGPFEPESSHLSIMVDAGGVLSLIGVRDISQYQKAQQIELKFYFKSKEYRSLKKKLKNIPNPTFADFVRLGEFKNTGDGIGMYDAARNMFINTASSLHHFQDKGRIFLINVRAFYKGGTVHLSFQTPEKDLQNDLPYFEEIMSSLNFEEEFRCPATGKR